MSQTNSARLDLADRLFRQYYYRCFWHMKPVLIVTEEMIPVIVAGLRNHGNRQAMFDAVGLLQSKDQPAHATDPTAEGSFAAPGQAS